MFCSQPRSRGAGRKGSDKRTVLRSSPQVQGIALSAAPAPASASRSHPQAVAPPAQPTTRSHFSDAVAPPPARCLETVLDLPPQSSSLSGFSAAEDFPVAEPEASSKGRWALKPRRGMCPSGCGERPVLAAEWSLADCFSWRHLLGVDKGHSESPGLIRVYRT